MNKTKKPPLVGGFFYGAKELYRCSLSNLNTSQLLRSLSKLFYFYQFIFRTKPSKNDKLNRHPKQKH